MTNTTIDAYKNSLILIDNASDVLCEVLDQVDPNTDLGKHCINQQYNRLANIGIIDSSVPYVYTEESIRDTLEKASKAVIDFIKKIVNKIKQLLKSLIQYFTKNKEDLKEVKETIKESFEPGQYKIDVRLIESLLRTKTIKNTYTVSDLKSLFTESGLVSSFYVKDVLLPITEYLKAFEKIISGSEFKKYNQNTSFIKQFSNKGQNVNIKYILKNLLKVEGSTQDTMGNTLEQAKVFTDKLGWDHWNSRPIVGPFKPMEGSVIIDVRSEKELLDFIDHVLSLQDKSVDFVIKKVEECNLIIDKIVSHYEKFVKEFEQGKCGDFWNKKQIRYMDSLLSEFSQISTMNNKVSRYALTVSKEVSSLIHHLSKDNRE